MRNGVLAGFSFLAALAAPICSYAAQEPPHGTYVFTKSYTIEGCMEYSGGRGIAAHCEKTGKKTYRVGEKIEVDTFFWDDQSQQWGAKVVLFGQYRSVPLPYIKLSQ